MVIVLLFFWLIAAFVIGFMGSGKKIGYWGVFFISVFLSPVVGIIVAIVSPPSINTSFKSRHLQYLEDIEKGKMAENRSDYNEAVRYYKDALYCIQNAPPTKEYNKIKYRTDRKNEIIERLNHISKL